MSKLRSSNFAMGNSILAIALATAVLLPSGTMSSVAIAQETPKPTASPRPAPPTGASATPAGLADATPIDVSSGSGMATGTVSTGHQVFSFTASAQDRVTLDVNVTETLPGATYTDDDSYLFVFNSLGRLIAENDDDGSSFQSLIDYVVIPTDGMYYAVVTTYPSRPILDENQVVTGWTDDGDSHIRFNLIIDGITPETE